MRMKRRRNSESGYALITAIAVGVVALSITSAVMLRMSSSTKQITQRENVDSAHAISESVLNHVLDAMADVTAKTENATGSGTPAGIYTSAKNLAEYLNKTDYLNTTDNDANSIIMSKALSSALPAGYQVTKFTTTGNANTLSFWTSLENNVGHSTAFWSTYRNNSSSTAMPAVINLTGTGLSISGFSIDKDLHDQAYSIYRVKKGSLEADVVVSIVPLATNVNNLNESTLHADGTFKSHNDVFKIRVDTFIPRLTEARADGEIHRVTPRSRMDVIVNRPVRRKDNEDFAFAHAVLAGGSVDLQNFDTSSGPCAGSGGGSCIDHTTSGDVHTNGSFTIGSNGHVQGKATASGTVTASGQTIPTSVYSGASGDPRDDAGVQDKLDNSHGSRSGVDQIPIPEVDTDTTGLPACVNTGTATHRVYENCIFSGTLDVNNNNSVTYKGTVRITGNVDIKGSQRCAGSAPCRIIIDGTADVGGNGDSNFDSEQDSIYIVNATGVSAGTTCMDIGGNPDASGQHGSLFYINNANCNARVRGNSEFFGGIITKGSVNTNGNATTNGIQRDSDMSSLSIFLKPDPVPKNELFPAIVAWKDLR